MGGKRNKTGKERSREDGPVHGYKKSNLFDEEIHIGGDVCLLTTARCTGAMFSVSDILNG